MTRADQLLEGFKLGKLGAGKKKFIDPQENFKIRILDEVSPVADNPFLKWEDFDGYIYSLNLLLSVNNTYLIRLSSVNKTKQHWWYLSSSSMTLKQAKHLFKQYFDLAKSGGIKKLLDSGMKFLSPDTDTEHMYKEWLAKIKEII
jgi:hypothetical protein